MAAPSTGQLLTDWSWEPSVIIGLFLLIGGYSYANRWLRRGRRLGAPATRTNLVFFVLSVLTLVVALLSPLDRISDDYLFSAHMIQHLLLGVVWAPFFLLSLPAWLVRPIFAGRIAGLARFLTYPAVAITLFNLDFYLWHLPALYDLTLSNEEVHTLEHLSFMAFGLLSWWPILSPIKAQRLSYPLQLLYLFLDGMLMMGLGIVFTFSPKLFYSGYNHVPRLWGISQQSDQEVGGLVMWYPGNVPYLIALVAAFYVWFEGEEERPASLRAESPTIERPPA